MHHEYEVRRSGRRCAASGRELAPGEAFYSALVDEPRGIGHAVERRDFAPEAWAGPPDGTLGWWRARTPGKHAAGRAPNEVLLRLLDAWQDQPQERAIRYLLALLLVRRRVLRVEQPTLADAFASPSVPPKRPGLLLYAPRTDTTYSIDVCEPSSDEAPALQARLTALIEGGDPASVFPAAVLPATTLPATAPAPPETLRRAA
jgi:hypothetical protein